jgi:hypothetical protein
VVVSRRTFAIVKVFLPRGEEGAIREPGPDIDRCARHALGRLTFPLAALAGTPQVPIADAVVAWTLLALLYGGLPKRAKEVRNCLLEANRLEGSRAQPVSEDASGQGLPVHLQAAQVLLDYHLPELAATALAAQEPPGSGGEALFDRQLSAARVKRLQGDLEGAAALLEGVVRDKDEEGRASVDLGHVRYAAGK